MPRSISGRPAIHGAWKKNAGRPGAGRPSQLPAIHAASGSGHPGPAGDAHSMPAPRGRMSQAHRPPMPSALEQSSHERASRHPQQAMVTRS